MPNTPGTDEQRAPRIVARLALLVVGLTVVLGGLGIALASWTTTGNGLGSGGVGTLDAPTGVSAAPTYATVTVTWAAATPPDGVLDGYVVSRDDGATSVPACGTDIGAPATFIPAGTLTCADTLVPDGSYTYTVTAVFRSWTSQSSPSPVISVSGDPSTPSQALSMVGPTGAYLGGSTIYFRSTVGGSFQLASTVSDGESGPASATFPVVSSSGWNHAAETVTTGTGTNPITYTSSAFSWTASPSTPGSYTVTGRDVGGNQVNTALSFAPDNTGPTGGALTVNGVAASAGGSVSTARAAFPINVRSDFNADAGSGLVSSILTREVASYNNGACGTFGSSVTIVGNPNQTGLTSSCYRYTLTGTDKVGNTSTQTTTVRYDATVPTQSITIGSATNASKSGNNVYVRTTAAGSFVLTSTVTDNESGPASAAFPAVTTAGWTHPAQTVTTGTGSVPTIAYSSTTYSWTTGAATPGTSAITASDAAGNTAATTLTFIRDTTAPVTGALNVNGTNGSAAGSTSFNRTGVFAITRTDYTDAASGIASSVLTVEQGTLAGNACSAYGAPTTLVGAPAQSGLATGCYRYVLRGTDNVGNTASRTTTVKVDRELPVGGALTVNGSAATAAGGTSFNTTGAFAIDSRTDWTDPASGIASSTLTRRSATLTNNVCGTYGAATTLTGAPAQTGLATSCYLFTLTGTDRAGNVSTISTTVKVDRALPVTGALTVNGTAASAAGTSSTSVSGSWAIVRTDFTDANSGLASSTLTREFATRSGATCGTFGAPTVLTGAPAQSGLPVGCYRYTLTGVDNAGNTTSLSTTVRW